MSKKILVVYNTCGISGKDNSSSYIESIKSILRQDFCDFDIVVSSCLNTQLTRDAMRDHFGDRIKYNFINEKHPVNVTFNHSIRKAIEHCGEYEGYMYVDSGSNFGDNTDLLSHIYSLLETNRYGMITPQPENDTEYFNGLGVGRHNNDDEYARKILFKDGDYTIPIGKGMGTHTNVVSNDLRKFYGNAYPDIFAGHCTESTFSFMNAAIKRQWLLLEDYILSHNISMDGQSSGFSTHEWIRTTRRPTYDHPYRITSILQRVLKPEASAAGFGYEECRDILRHDPSQFDESFHCLNEDLKYYIKDNLFLKEIELNYDTIESVYYN
tara:strand:+ start:241 stop:1215 length:975 start_codon:yes stop_codon:yes gene_type:complete